MPRSCLVRIHDGSVAHEIEINASSLFEAAALGYRQLCEDGWSAKAAEDAIALEISIPQPAVVHRVTLEKLRAYANSVGKPGDRAERSRIKAMLEGR